MKVWDLGAGKTKSTGSQGVNAMMFDNFSISGSSQPTQVHKNYQQIDVAAGGMYSSSLKAT